MTESARRLELELLTLQKEVLEWSEVIPTLRTRVAQAEVFAEDWHADGDPRAAKADLAAERGKAKIEDLKSKLQDHKVRIKVLKKKLKEVKKK
jgi:predicted RNase H-like nuclease (RuvC/YqgF family)